MKILITGSRSLKENAYEQIKKVMTKHTPTLLLHGGAKGADQLAQRYADEHGIPTKVMRPDYKNNHYKTAPLLRNTELVKNADYVIALYAEGRTRKGGTWDTVQKAIATHKPITEVLPNGNTRHIQPTLTLL